MPQHIPDEQGASRVVVLEGSPLGTPVATAFATIEDAEAHVLARVRANTLVNLRERMEHAISERIVSEDGVAAVSEVIGGKLAFLRALTTAYAPRVTIVPRHHDDDDDDRR
ncbi:MAG: hypothetical protein JNL19_03375 [Burkholderiales bacterium]|nr:hypothetical protein [Burkholderiales bacterium]